MLMLVAVLCVPMAILGLSSGLLFAVRTQSREIGIKLALGASPRQARWTVTHAALRLTVIGGAIGVLTGIGIGTLMDHQLFEVSPIDPVSVVAVLGAMLATPWCAAWVPGTKASRIDPAVALRSNLVSDFDPTSALGQCRALRETEQSAERPRAPHLQSRRHLRPVFQQSSWECL